MLLFPPSRRTPLIAGKALCAHPRHRPAIGGLGQLKASVADLMPTQAGDVLILYKDGSPLHVIGLLTDDALQTVTEHQIQEIGRNDAIRTARRLVKRGRRIYLKNIDTGWWVGLK